MQLGLKEYYYTHTFYEVGFKGNSTRLKLMITLFSE